MLLSSHNVENSHSTLDFVVLDNTLYDKGLFNISGTHPIKTKLIKDYSPI